MDDKDGILCLGCGGEVYKIGKFDARLDHIDGAFAAFEYCDRVRESVFRFKYDMAKSLARQMGAEMAGEVEDCDFLLPVPLHEKRLKARGYNQSALLAVEIGELLGLPVYDGLERLRYTEKQFGLSAPARQENLREAIGVKAGLDVEGKQVLLVDDIFTTGTTASECGRALKNAGAKRVDICVFAAVDRVPIKSYV